MAWRGHAAGADPTLKQPRGTTALMMASGLGRGLGVFAKGGAEGVMVMVAPNGATVALKMLDGSSRATTAVALRLLERAGALVASDVSDAMSRLSLSVTGGGQDVGAIRPAF